MGSFGASIKRNQSMPMKRPITVVQFSVKHAISGVFELPERPPFPESGHSIFDC